MDLKNRPLDEPTLGEGILESLANVAALASGGLLGLIGVQLGMAATSLGKKRLLSTINNLIEEKIIYNLINNESLIDATRISFDKIAKEHSSEKREYMKKTYIDYIKNIDNHKIDIEKFEIFMATTSDLFPTTLKVLACLKNILEKYKSTGDLHFSKWYQEFFNESQKIAGPLWIKSIHDLEANGIIYPMSNGAFLSQNAMEITEFGHEFMAWLLDSDESVRQANS